MTLKRKSAGAVMLFLVLFIISAFVLLSLKDGVFDAKTIVFGGVFALYVLVQYNLLSAGFRHFDRFVLLAAQVLYSIGMVVIYRISPSLALKQFMFLLLGSVLMVPVIHIIKKSSGFGRLNWVFMGLSLAMLAGTLVFGRTVGGARNWIYVGPFSLQPSEFAKILFVIVSAHFLSTRNRLVSFIPYVVYTGICLIVQVLAKDLGSTLLIGLTFMIMFYTATGRIFTTLAGVGVLGAGAVASYHLFSHVRTRVMIWQDPWAYYNGSGYQIVQGLLALAAGGLLGVGLGCGMPSVIPAAQTDYIFTVIGEEFGIIVGVMVIAFYIVFIFRGMIIARDTDNSFDGILVFGCTAMLALQSFIIIGGVIKLIPLTGITLPFISYGGSSLTSSLIMVGIIEGVAIKNGMRDEKEIDEMGGVAD